MKKIPLALVFVAQTFCLLSVSSGQINEEQAARQNKFIHPDRVEIPNDLRFVVSRIRTEKDGQKVTIREFPVIEYQRFYYKGWQKCLSAIAERGTEPAKNLGASIPQTDQRHIIQGLQDGYQSVLAAVRSHEELGISEEEIRTLCREAYRPDLLPPPLPEIRRDQDEVRQKLPR